MGAMNFERWARQAVDLEQAGRFEPVASAAVLDDIADLERLHRMTWERRERLNREGGLLVGMAEGTYGAMMAYPNPQTVTTTAIAGSVNLWPQAIYTPLPANAQLAPQAYRLIVSGKITTGATPGNIGFDPRIGSTGTWTK